MLAVTLATMMPYRQVMTGQTDFATWQPLRDLDWKPFEKLIRASEIDVPLERPIITPVGLTRSDLLKRVYPKN